MVDGRVNAWISEEFTFGAQSVAVVGGRAKAWISEEKGSDVNLASWLLLGAVKDEFQKALVITNDSDLAEPIRIVTEELGLEVVLGMPLEGPHNMRKPTRHLTNVSTANVLITQKDLAACHLSATVGKYTKPRHWTK